jgi:PAS domain S-box-containing protein
MVIGGSRVPLGRLSSEGVAVGQTLDDSEPAFAGSRELYEAVVRAIGDGIVVRSALGECLFANEQAARLLGFAAVDDVTGSSSRAVAERLARVDRATAVEVHDDEDGELRYVVTFLGAGGIGEAAAVPAGARDELLYREAKRASALLDSLYASAPIGLGFWDRDLRYVRVNDALARINERSPEAHVGRSFAEVVPQLAEVIEPIARRVLETGEPATALQLSAGTPHDPEAERDWLASYYPVLAPDGEPLGVGAVIEEVTQRRRAERRSDLQHAVTRVLTDAESVADAVPAVLRAVCETIDWDVGCYWPIDPEGPRLTWARADLHVEGFVAMTQRASLTPALLPGRVAASGKAEWLDDMTAARFARSSVAVAEGLRCGVAFPVVIEGKVAGVLEIFSRVRREADGDLLRALDGLGSQLGQFLRRKRAEDERAQMLQRERHARADAEAAALTLRKLERVSAAVLVHLSLHDLLQSLLRRIVEVLEADVAAILLIGDDGRLYVRATAGLDAHVEPASPIELGAGVAGRVAETRETMVVPDLSQVELASSALRDRGINSLVALPLIVADEVIGVVQAGSEALAQFVEADARLLELIADRIALAINQAALYEAERAAEERLRFLGEATTALASSLDLDVTLRQTARLATARFADAAVVDLADGDAIARVVVEMRPDATSPEVRRLLDREPSRADEDGPGRVIGTGEPEVRREPSRVFMPLRVRGQILGVLGLVRVARRFDDRDVETVRELAARAAAAVDNAKLFQEAEQSRDRLGFLAEASALLGASLDVEATLEQLGSLVAGRAADWCTIHLADDDGARLVSVAHRDSERVAFARAAIAQLRPTARSSEGVGHVIASGRPELYPQLPPELLEGPARDVGVHSALIVPLVARGRTLGAMSWAWAETARSYDAADLDLALDLAARAAVAIDNAQLYREAEERAQAARVLDSVGDGVFLVDRHGAVRTWNRAAAVVTGLQPEAVIDRTALEAIPGWAAVVSRVPVAAAGTTGPRAESLPLDLGERELWLSLHGVAVPDGVVYAFRDLTDERALETMRTEFVSTVSHELRTPLAAIYGAAMTLRRTDVALDDEQRARMLEVVSGEADRLARTVNDILWASRLDAGSLHVTISSCDPAALAQDVLEAQRAHLDRSHELVMSAEPDLPQVAGDPDKVGRVLINLVDNAIKYSPDGGRVQVGLRRVGGHVRLSVSDPGLGIPSAEQRRVFEKFYRLDPNMTRGVGGTGLGLYICRELVRRMDGRIWVDSGGLGRGSTFHIELPVSEL